MKNNRRVITICIVVLIAICIYIVAQPWYSMSEDLVGENRTVNYHTLNVRETPDGKVVGILELNSTVSLTGKTCQMVMQDEPYDYWMEIQYQGDTAWVTGDALIR